MESEEEGESEEGSSEESKESKTERVKVVRKKSGFWPAPSHSSNVDGFWDTDRLRRLMGRQWRSYTGQSITPSQ